MKWGRALLPLLVLVSSCVCLAQDNRPAPDVPIRTSMQAMRDGRFSDAEKILTDAVQELEKSDPQSPRLANYLERLAGLASRRGNREDANALMERAQEINLKAFGPTDMRRTHALLEQADAAKATGDNAKVERLLNESLGIVRANSERLNAQPYTAFAAEVFGGLATFYIDQHRWIEADSMLQEETKLCGMIEEPYRTGFALCGGLAETLAEVYSAEGRTVDTSRLPYQGNEPRELDALNKAGKQFEKDWLYPSAEDTYNRGIALATKIEADPQNLREGLIVEEMNFLGQVFEKEGYKDRAENTYLSALEINEKKAGPGLGHSAYANMISPLYLINLYRGEGRLQDAALVLQRVLEIQEKSLGERSRKVVQTLTMLAEVYKEQGKTEQALALYERAIKIQEENLGPSDRELVPLLRESSDLMVKLHKDAQAAELQSRITAIESAARNHLQ
jgi:tetratricopeptide (TPR) repeat protein